MIYSNKIKRIWLTIIIGICLISACSKNNDSNTAVINLTADSLIYNTVTHKFSPDSTVMGSLKSSLPIRFIYFYLVREGTPDSLIYIYFDTAATGDHHKLSFKIPLSRFKDVNLSDVEGIKAFAKLNNNSSYESFIKIKSISPAMPEINNFPDTLGPNTSGTPTPINGSIRSESGLKKIIIADDRSGEFIPLDSITSLNGAGGFDLDYDYIYGFNASHIKITATDINDLSTSFVIFMPTLSYILRRNVVMTGQGLNQNFMLSSGDISNACGLDNREPEINFLVYYFNSVRLYSPQSASAGMIKAFRCDGNYWSPDGDRLNETRFRVLLPGEYKELYEAVRSNSITEINYDFFNGDLGISRPASTIISYSENAEDAASNWFNAASNADPSSAYLIWCRTEISQDGSYQNILIKVNDVIGGGAQAKLNLDLYIEKK